MKKQLLLVLATATCAICALYGIVPAQTTIYGGRGLLRTHSAESVGKSQFYINTYFATFLEPGTSKSTLGKDHTLTIGLTLGLSRYLELTALLTPYQDDQQHIWGPPGDSQLGIKVRTPFSGDLLQSALRVFAKFPTARSHNVPYEPYSSDKIGFGLVGVLTFDFTESFPLIPLKAHVNFGYMDHNVKDELFNSQMDQLLIRAGLKFPIRSSVLYTEYSAEIFADNPLVSSYALNSQRVTQGLKLLGPWDLIIDLAVDFSLSESPQIPDKVFLKEYADWKVVFGLNYQMLFRNQTETPRLARKSEEEVKNKAIVEEMNRKRQQVRDELKRMEDSLDGTEKKKKTASKDGNQR